MVKKDIKLVLALGLTIASLNGCAVFAAGAAAGVATSVATDPRPTEIQAQDNAIKGRLVKKINFSSNSALKQSDIAVTVYNGAVLLTGQAVNSTVKHHVETLAMSQQGVRTVYDEINVVGKINKNTGEQTLTDTRITTAVKAKLLLAKGINSDDIKVVTVNNNVYLLGIVTKKEAAIAANIASQVAGVKLVKQGFTIR